MAQWSIQKITVLYVTSFGGGSSPPWDFFIIFFFNFVYFLFYIDLYDILWRRFESPLWLFLLFFFKFCLFFVLDIDLYDFKDMHSKNNTCRFDVHNRRWSGYLQVLITRKFISLLFFGFCSFWTQQNFDAMLSWGYCSCNCNSCIPYIFYLYSAFFVSFFLIIPIFCKYLNLSLIIFCNTSFVNRL